MAATTSADTSFHFLALPAEIRQQVYADYFSGGSVTFENHVKASDIFHKRHPFWFHVGSQINLLLTCRQIHREAHELVYEYDTVILQGEDGLGQLAQACTLSRRKHIKHLVNASTHTYRYSKYLSYLPGLQTLHIQHRSTFYTVPSGTRFADDATFGTIMMAINSAGLDSHGILGLRENTNTNYFPSSKSKSKNKTYSGPWLSFTIDVPIYYNSVIDPETLHDYGFGYKFPSLPSPPVAPPSTSTSISTSTSTSVSSSISITASAQMFKPRDTEYEGKNGELGVRTRVCVPCTLDVLAQTVVKHFDRIFVVRELPPSYRSLVGEPSPLADAEWESYIDDVTPLEKRYAKFLDYSGSGSGGGGGARTTKTFTTRAETRSKTRAKAKAKKRT